MSSELERYKRALEGARHVLGMVERNPQVLRDHNYIGAVQREIDDILHPPTEWEDVEVVRWAVIAPSGYVETTYATKELAEHEVAADGMFKGYEVAKLTGTIRRAKKQPVERSAMGRVTGEDFGSSGIIKVSMVNANDAYPLRNKRVVIAWTE